MNYTKEIIKKYKNKKLFTTRDIRLNFKIKPNYLNLLIHNLLKQKKITKLAKGTYTFREELEIVGFAYFPFYYGLQDALSYHGLWKQETIPVIITSKKIKPGIRQINNNNILLRRINRKYLFGVEYKQINDIDIPISDIEKTLIDLVYYRQPINKETITEFRKRINKEKLNNYLEKYPVTFKKKALTKINFLI